VPCLGLAVCACALLAVVHADASSSISEVRRGGIVRIAMVATDLDSLDPALAYAAQSSVLLDTTCARLLVSSGHATPDGSGLVPEVAAGPPRRSRDGRTYTFTLRDDFRFSDGTPVRADAFARAIDRTLAPDVESPWRSTRARS
jgi:peptide/nickel transport system substrate-binding protein